MAPHHEIVATVEFELDQASTWARRRAIDLAWSPSQLTMRTVLNQNETGEVFFLQGVFDDYKELPPAWEFYDESWQRHGEKGLFPANNRGPFGSSIFHATGPSICAPFNRLAYKELGGPHDNWGGVANWRNVRGNHVRANTIGGMLQQIIRHFAVSRGRMG